MSSEAEHPLVVTIGESDESAYVLSSDLRILCVSKGWAAFAENNGGAAMLRRWPVGARMDDALPPALRQFYLDAFASVLSTGERWELEYECSSPTNYRKFRMVVYPIEGERLVVTNALVVDVPHSRPDHAPDELYARSGFVTMCANCRRTSNPRTLSWDWVPSYVASMPPHTSHGLCLACFEFYFPGTDQREAG